MALQELKPLWGVDRVGLLEAWGEEDASRKGRAMESWWTNLKVVVGFWWVESQTRLGGGHVRN